MYNVNMENEFRVIDVILAVILVVIMCIGIGMYVVKYFNYPRELTIDNYKEHLSIRIVPQPTGIKDTILRITDYTIVFEQKSKLKITKCDAQIRITGKSIDSQTLTVSFSVMRGNPYKYDITLNTSEPPSYNGAIVGWYNFDVEIISISGQLSRG